MAQPRERLDRAGDRQVDPLDRVDQLGAAHKARPGIGPLEIGPGRALRRKGVGLVLKPADRDPRHVLPFPKPWLPYRRKPVSTYPLSQRVKTEARLSPGRRWNLRRSRRRASERGQSAKPVFER